MTDAIHISVIPNAISGGIYLFQKKLTAKQGRSLVAYGSVGMTEKMQNYFFCLAELPEFSVFTRYR